MSKKTTHYKHVKNESTHKAKIAGFTAAALGASLMLASSAAAQGFPVASASFAAQRSLRTSFCAPPTGGPDVDFLSSQSLQTGTTPIAVTTEAIRYNGFKIPLNLDSDRRLDMVTVNDNGEMGVYRNLDGDTYQIQDIYTTGYTELRQVKASDIDRDGDIDLVVMHNENAMPGPNGGFLIYYNNGDGTFGSPDEIVNNGQPQQEPRNFTVADFNSDTYPDLVASIGQFGIASLPNSGGTFGSTWNNQQVLFVDPRKTMEAFDLDGDGDLDLQTTNEPAAFLSPETFLRYRNTTSTSGGTITFFTGGLDFNQYDLDSQGAVVADFDQDGDIDVVGMLNPTNEIVLLLNNGSGVFTEAPGGQYSTGANSGSATIQVADLNGDAWMDIVVANRYDDSFSYFENDQSGGFFAAEVFPLNHSPHWIAVADANGINMCTQRAGDGDLDIFTVDPNGDVHVSLNTRIGND